MLTRQKKWVVVLSAIILIVMILIGIITIRTISHPSKQPVVSTKIHYPLETDQVVGHLSKALQIPTISNAPAGVDWDQFSKFRTFLEQTFPGVHSTLERKIHNQYNLIYIWKGSDTQKKPVLLLAHYDVFAITDPGWKYPPFSGTPAEGYVWGRGALDDKAGVMSILEAMEYLVKTGFKPARTIYIALGCDEENGGRQGAQKEAEYFKAQGLSFECILDEGLISVQGVFPGLPASQWVTLIGTAEKGFLNLKLSTQAEGGHSSIPARETAIGILAQAIHKLEKTPFPTRWTGATSDLLGYLGPEARFPYKEIFANLWLFGPLVQNQLAANPKSDALIRTTTAPTVFRAGEQPASVPGAAAAVVNFRLLPGDTVKSAMERVKSVIGDPRVQVETLSIGEGVWDPPAVSSSDSWSFKVLSRTAREVMPDVLVAPCLVTGATDARHFVTAGLSQNVFRGLVAKVPLEDLAGLHGVNERIRIDSYLDMINFYVRLMQNMNGN